ncbi:MAG: hypothetical protein ACERKV_02430 [Clostridiaceae bacterium]
MKKNLIYFLVACICLSFIGCSKKEEEKCKMNMYINIKDQYVLEILDNIIQEYKEKNPNCEVNIVANLNNKISENEQNVDINITEREEFIMKAKTGNLMNLENYYEKEKIYNNYANLTSSYGRYHDINYGIAILPKEMKLLYNKELNDNILSKEDITSITKKLNSQGAKIPIFLGKEDDPNNIMLSIVAYNIVNLDNIERLYDNKEGYLKEIYMEKIFSNLDLLYKQGVISKDLFYLGNSNDLNSFNAGDIPILITDNRIDYNEAKISLLNSNIFFSNSVISVPIKAENKNEVDKFIEYLYSDELLKKLANENILTGNNNFDRIKVTSDNWYLLDAIPSRFDIELSKTVDNILEGKYNGSEWQSLIENVYK